MDEREYWEKFRLAILVDEFRGREFPEAIKVAPCGWQVRYLRRLLNKYRKQSLPLPRFDWFPIVLYGADIEMYLRCLFEKNGLKDDCAIFSLRHSIWLLRHALIEVKNPDVLDYYEHLLYVAQEVLDEVDKLTVRS